MPVILLAFAALWMLGPATAGADAAPAASTGAGERAPDLEQIARDLIAASPMADDGDAAARDAAGARLAHCRSLLGSCGETILWGGFDPDKGYDPRSYTMTLFSPLVWARLYLSEFMFPGQYSVRTEGPFRVLELAAKFRCDLDSGDFPYPFWHSADKWNAYVNAGSVMLVARDGQIVAGFRKPDPHPVRTSRRWDGRWHWTDENGEEQPRVALFEYLLSEDNPHREALESSYRKLEKGFRSQQCHSCHAPDNPAQASPLVMLVYPNQSLGARHQIVDELRGNLMPPTDPVMGTARGIHDEPAREDLVTLAEDFAREGDAALAYEQELVGVADGGKKETPAEQAPQWTTTSDNWYSLTLAGMHAGWMRVAREEDGSRYRTVTEMTLSFHRSGTQLDADNYVEWVETHDGRPVRLEVARRNREKRTNFNLNSAWEDTRDGDPLGLLTSRRAWEFGDDSVTKVAWDDEGNEVRSPTAAPAGAWLTPVAAERFIRQRLADDARLIEYGALDASDELRFVTVQSTLVGRSQFALDGNLIPVTVWHTHTSANPSQTISQYSPDGKLVYSAVDLGVGLLETRRCSKEEALSPGDAMVSTVEYPVVEPDQPLRASARAVFELRIDDGTLPPLPSAGAQSVVMAADGASARISVDSTGTSPATSPELEESRQRTRSPLAGRDNPVVLDLAAQAIRETRGLGPAELAASSREVVHRHFAGRAPAQPTVPVAAGSVELPDPTGSEQARMLCSVLRVHRIPSRVVAGLAYTEAPPHERGAFQWRVWAQALLGGQWVDLDPAGAGDFDAGHILAGVGEVGVADADPDPAGFSQLLSKVGVKIVSQE